MAKRPPNAAKSEPPPRGVEGNDSQQGDAKAEGNHKGSLGAYVRETREREGRSRSTPYKLTPDRFEAILTLLRDSVPFRHACLRCGISPQAVEQHMQRDELIAFEVERARALGAGGLHSRLVAAADADAKSWRAYESLLERLYPRDYGPAPTKAELTGKDGGPIEQSGGLQVTITDAKRIIRERRAKGETK